MKLLCISTEFSLRQHFGCLVNVSVIYAAVFVFSIGFQRIEMTAVHFIVSCRNRVPHTDMVCRPRGGTGFAVLHTSGTGAVCLPQNAHFSCAGVAKHRTVFERTGGNCLLIEIFFELCTVGDVEIFFAGCGIKCYRVISKKVIRSVSS